MAICAECGKELLNKRSDAIYCSDKCCDRRKVSVSNCKNCNLLFRPKRGLGLKVCCCLSCYKQYRRGQTIESKRKLNQKEKTKTYNYFNKIKCRNDLLIGYVKDKLQRQGINNPTAEIIEEKRLVLKIKRKIKQIKDETTK